jgi:acetyl-CoA carboxylase biotin carboxyl carrier protein
MPLTDDDIREILRLIDESDLEELRIETGELSLHVVRDRATATPAQHDTAVETSRPAPPQTAALAAVSAPMLGMFYRAPAPGASPFVDVGSEVESDTVVGLIEVMKMMNPVPAGVAGTVVEVCVDNAELVEHGAVLFRVRPGGAGHHE